MKLSGKYVMDLEDCYQSPLYTFPRHLANGRDPITKKPCVCAGINTKSIHIPINTPTEVSNDYWSLLRQAGIMQDAVITTARGEYREFDPVRSGYEKKVYVAKR